MNILDASNILMLIQTRVNHHHIRAVNIEIVFEPDFSEESAEIAQDLLADGVLAQAIMLDDPEGNEYPAFIVNGW
jgi:hypothetical protein